MEKVKYISVAWILFAGIVFILLIGMLFILTVYANAQATVTEYTTDQPGMDSKVSIYNVDCNWYNNKGEKWQNRKIIRTFILNLSEGMYH